MCVATLLVLLRPIVNLPRDVLAVVLPGSIKLVLRRDMRGHVGNDIADRHCLVDNTVAVTLVRAPHSLAVHCSATLIESVAFGVVELNLHVSVVPNLRRKGDDTGGMDVLAISDSTHIHWHVSGGRDSDPHLYEEPLPAFDLEHNKVVLEPFFCDFDECDEVHVHGERHDANVQNTELAIGFTDTHLQNRHKGVH